MIVSAQTTAHMWGRITYSARTPLTEYSSIGGKEERSLFFKVNLALANDR